VATRTIATNGVRLSVVDEGRGPLVLLLHGFPESAYSWRHQIPALTAAGYRVLAPNQRGYAGSDAPPRIDDYDIFQLTSDVVGLIDAAGEQSAVVVGHDWGALVAWWCAVLHPDRVRAVAGLSVAFTGRAPARPTEIFRRVAGDGFFYILYFQEPGVAEAELERDVSRTLRLTLHSASGERSADANLLQKPKGAGFLDGLAEPEHPPSWLGAEDLARYVGEFERSGFRGPVNWYRNFDRNWELTEHLAGAKVEQPALFLGGDRDPVLSFTPLHKLGELVPRLRRQVLFPGCGHWTQQERPKEVNEELVAFLRGA
jgi:pimeloyl-ACP methyl ester carboxylesterase